MRWLALTGLMVGCAQRDEVRLARLLRELELLAEPVSPAGYASSAETIVSRAPVASDPVKIELPDTGLPPLPPPPSSSSGPARGAGAPPGPAPVPAPMPGSGSESRSLTIQPDCMVQIRVEQDPTLDGTYVVNSLGAVQLGYVGPVILWNRTEEEAAQKIADVLKSRDFRNATVSVKIVRASYDRIQVSGAVQSPGVIPIGAGDAISLSDALLRAGGVTASATKAVVRIVRGGLLSPLAASLPGEEYPLTREDGSPSIPEIYLRNNDLVRVVAMGGGPGAAATGEGAREVLVLGEVKRPGFYSFPPGEPCTLMHLVFKMGGLPPYANTKAIKVIRMHRDGSEEEYRVDMRRVLSEGDPRDDFSLEHGDRVIVPARRISLF